jgi:hypothetical protein
MPSHAAWVQQLDGISRGDRLEDSPMRNSPAGYKPTVPFRKLMAAAVSQVDDLLSVEEDDRRHLFYEQMKEFFYAMRDIRPEEIDDSTIVEILEASDQLMEVIHKIRLKRKQQLDKEKADKRFLL